jgi:hypothetical protein
MRSRFTMAWFAAALVAVLTVAAYAQDEPTEQPTASSASAPKKTSNPSEPALRRDMFVSLSVVQQFFPEVNRDTLDTDANALGKPVATRTSSYTSKDASKKVMLSVDQYQNAGEAMYAYQDAARKSENSEANPIAISNVGQQVFAYTITQGTETRPVITSLDDTLIVRATLAGYDGTTDNIAKLAELTGKEVEQAHTHVSAHRRR